MQVLVTEAARAYVKSRGGSVYVRAHPHRCCTGALTVLDATTDAPADSSDFLAISTGKEDGVEVRYRGGGSGLPERLTIELRGVLRRRPVALWDGCAYKL